MPRASSRSSARLVSSSDCARSSSDDRLGIAVHPLARLDEQHRKGHQPRLRAIVQVALQTPALGVAGLY